MNLFAEIDGIEVWKEFQKKIYYPKEKETAGNII